MRASWGVLELVGVIIKLLETVVVGLVETVGTINVDIGTSCNFVAQLVTNRVSKPRQIILFNLNAFYFFNSWKITFTTIVNTTDTRIEVAIGK